jgi:hypothetical protein
MGIGWTLQGVDAASSARNAAESISGRVVLGSGLDSDRASGGSSEVWGADPRRTSGKGC